MNVDMGELIEDLMKTKVPPLAYSCIQKFLTKVGVPFYFFIHSFYKIEHLFLFFAFFQVGAGRTRPNTKPRVHTGIDIFSADELENLHVVSRSIHN
jgi:hypothetical protein